MRVISSAIHFRYPESYHSSHVLISTLVQCHIKICTTYTLSPFVYKWKMLNAHILYSYSNTANPPYTNNKSAPLAVPNNIVPLKPLPLPPLRQRSPPGLIRLQQWSRILPRPRQIPLHPILLRLLSPTLPQLIRLHHFTFRPGRLPRPIPSARARRHPRRNYHLHRWPARLGRSGPSPPFHLGSGFCLGSYTPNHFLLLLGGIFFPPKGFLSPAEETNYLFFSFSKLNLNLTK